MSQPERIGFLGFGEAARAFCASLAKVAPTLRFFAYDIKLHGEEAMAMRSAMANAGVSVAGGPGDLAPAQWIFSAVTADQSLKAVEPLVQHLRAGQTLIDINSVSPARKQETARRVATSGARYLDMAVMAPVHPKGHATPVLLAGACVEEMGVDLERLGFSHRLVGDKPGAATAIKMVRSVFVKGLEAITIEALLAAEASGCRDEIMASLSASYPGLGWPEIASYHFERTLTHGARRAAEMEESAATLNDLGLSGALASAIAAVQRAQGAVGQAVNCPQDLAATIAGNLAGRLHAGTE